ncbi:MAG: tyrosine--tRNA ligase [Gammaproteobacteria bacterium]|nr:tyrosine--tRNA ligase [Gammaproteobacteria bacterium]
MSSALYQQLLERGLVYQSNDFEKAFELAGYERQSAYLGYDCTAPSLHVGHLMGIMLLRQWQKAGHRPILLFGSATTLIGDPTGKHSARVMLTPEVVAANKANMIGVFKQFLDFDDPDTGAIVVDNIDWWKDVSYLDLLRTVGPLLTVNRMVSFDTVKRRLEQQQPLSFLEFNYMILQGYDFVHLLKNYRCRYQFGGSDQWGNMIVGTDLIDKMESLPQSFIVTTPLLTNSSGQKMGKTENGAVWLNADMCSDYDYWQFWRNCSDEDCQKLLLAFTDCPTDEIISLCEAAKNDAEKMNQAKILLANEQTKMCRGKAAQEASYMRAQAAFSGSLEEKRLALQQLSINDEAELLIDFLVRHQLAESKSFARKLIMQNGVRVDDIVVTDLHYKFEKSGLPVVLSLGKKRHYTVTTA